MAAGCAQEPPNSTRRLMNKNSGLVNGVITRYATVKIGKTHRETVAAVRNTKQHKRSAATNLPMKPARTRLPQAVVSPSGLFSYHRGDLANSQGKHSSFEKVLVSYTYLRTATHANHDHHHHLHCKQQGHRQQQQQQHHHRHRRHKHSRDRPCTFLIRNTLCGSPPHDPSCSHQLDEQVILSYCYTAKLYRKSPR